MNHQGIAGSATERPLSLNERLNKASDRLHVQIDRIENVLARVNGTPISERAAVAGKLAQITPTLPMTSIVDQLEAAASRLSDIAGQTERIA